MIGELVAVALVVVLPATIVLGSLALIGLSIAGIASDDLAEGRLIRRGTPD